MKKVFTNTQIKLFIVIFSVVFISLAVSLAFFIKKGQGKRYSFIFPSADTERQVVENRYLKKNQNKDEVYVYIEELLLGSSIERTKMIFTAGTKVLSCFERDHVLYVDLSPDLIYEGDNVIAIQDGIELLKKNIRMNFANISEIQVFVNGNYAYEIFPKK